MACNTQNLPPYIRAATVYGVVTLRRTTQALWAGRGLKKLEYAKKGFLSVEREVLEWREVRNTCVVCLKPSRLTVLWQGPGRERPKEHDGAKAELRKLAVKPVKVMDAYICGTCRITTLPRLVIATQWDLSGVQQEAYGCTCQWDGIHVHYCHSCTLQVRNGRLLTVGSAKGWQVRRFLEPIQTFKTTSEGEGQTEPPITPDPPITPGGTGPSDAEPSAPTLCPIHWMREDSGGDARGGGEQTPALLEQALQRAWPYDPCFGRVANPPMDTIQVSQLIRVYRKQDELGAGKGIEQLPDDERQLAQQGGWLGPWELTTWAKLVEEVMNSPDSVLEDLPKAPREEGIRGSKLYYFTTGLDAWACTSIKAKGKTRQFTVTPEEWHRDGVIQVPGGVATRAATPLDPRATVRVKVRVQMMMVPFKGIYSIGADIILLEEAEPAVRPPTPGERMRAWLQRSFSGERSRSMGSLSHA